MISKDNWYEALDVALQPDECFTQPLNVRLREMVDTFYASIGSCGECRHLDKQHMGYGFEDVCTMVLDDDMPRVLDDLSWYCADFERREDE